MALLKVQLRNEGSISSLSNGIMNDMMVRSIRT